MPPLISIHQIRLPLPNDNDRRAHDQRFRDALALDRLSIPLGALRKIPREMGVRREEIRCVTGCTGGAHTLIAAGSGRSFSLALDLGTTNLVALLFDNVAQSDVLTMSFENPQIRYGSDILSRMHAAMAAGGHQVYDLLREGINSAIRTVCREAGIASREVHALVVAGNTVMSHFFLGLDISTIPVDPFVPVVRAPGFLSAAELKLELHPEGLVYVFPNAGSYVGGDIIAGIVASGMDLSARPSVLIDVGTNAEVVIGNRDWILTGAGAAGPALEEGVSRIGRRASGGIIYDVEIADSRVACKTFDGREAEGICGSGMVSLLHALSVAGVIDQRGVLDPRKANVAAIDGEPAYGIPCGGRAPLFIRQTEIQNLLMSKAAMFTLLLALTRSVGIAFKDIGQVFVSGALGTGIDANKAAAIGMLPAWPADIVTPLGNSSLQGARMLLIDTDVLARIDAVMDTITYKHMHDDPEFMREFQGAVFIPHTNPELLKVE